MMGWARAARGGTAVLVLFVWVLAPSPSLQSIRSKKSKKGALAKRLAALRQMESRSDPVALIRSAIPI